MGKTKKEAIEQLVDFCSAYLNINLSVDDAARLLDFITTEDGENGLSLLPPLTKKGKYEWEQE